MLRIKLKRIGKKHQPSYRVIVAEKRSKLDGKNVEDLGWLNPRSKEMKIDKEKALNWIKNGAKPTDTVHNLFVKAKILESSKIAVHKKKKVETENK